MASLQPAECCVKGALHDGKTTGQEVQIEDSKPIGVANYSLLI